MCENRAAMSLSWQWRPRSALILVDPPSFANVSVIRTMLEFEGSVDLRYHGDRMAPLVRDGEAIRVVSAGPGPPPDGAMVVADVAGIPDLYVVERAGRGTIRLAAPSDPDSVVSVAPGAVLGFVEAAERRTAGPRFVRSIRRLRIDLGEAIRGPFRSASGDHHSVLGKYSVQAPYYASGSRRDLDAGLLADIESRAAPPARVVVVGSGVGTEAMALARRGFEVTGVDGAPEMVRIARSQAEEQNLDIDYRQADISDFALPSSTVDLILFTYDVYSFLSGGSRRVGILRAMRSWLRPRGVVLLSARIASGLYEHSVLTVQWAAGRIRGERGWGRSHTRWIVPDGGLQRSFVQVFVPAMVAREATKAGFETESPGRGHIVLRPSIRETDP